MVIERNGFGIQQSAERFKKACPKDISELKFDLEKNGELIASCLDVLYCATAGNLWDGHGISADIEGTLGPRQQGVVINFVPLLTSENTQEKAGIFIFQSKDMAGHIFASAGVKCRLTGDGHQDVQGKISAYDRNFVIRGISSLAITRGKEIISTHD
jgi:hypothetical protein